MGVTTVASLAVAGFVLGRISFPLNFQIVFVVFSLMGLWAYRYGSRLLVPDHPLADKGNRPPVRARIGGAIRLVRGEPAFIGFEPRRVVYAMGTTLALTHEVAFSALLAGAAAIFTSGVNLAIFDRLMTTVPAGYGVTFNSIDKTVVNVAGMAAPVLDALLADRIGLDGALGVASVIGVCGALLLAVDRAGSPSSEPGGATAGS